MKSTTNREQPPAPPPSRFPIKIASICGKIWLWAIWNFLFIKNFARYRCELLLSSSFNLVGISRCGRTSNWIEGLWGGEFLTWTMEQRNSLREGRKEVSPPRSIVIAINRVEYTAPPVLTSCCCFSKRGSLAQTVVIFRLGSDVAFECGHVYILSGSSEAHGLGRQTQQQRNLAAAVSYS